MSFNTDSTNHTDSGFAPAQNSAAYSPYSPYSPRPSVPRIIGLSLATAAITALIGVGSAVIVQAVQGEHKQEPTDQEQIVTSVVDPVETGAPIHSEQTETEPAVITEQGVQGV
ncbi:hypothetical protein EML15_08885 [Corynebacterium sp. sy017]|uniref:hypothetical protein n=1 Tax=unclassified Corynebacterium TaxID=2624378 RepID=UPI001186E76E|nr:MULTISPECIES: hypothetical protein [unclassified Corynebacterium]MBP3089259.1 hypothetical protein [Corynebacterium sp. sy017]TSD91034.1 hypothetical protein ELY17_09715 [Corynebacterium sp. SY003]